MGPEQETRPQLHIVSDMKAISSWSMGVRMCVCLMILLYKLKSL